MVFLSREHDSITHFVRLLVGRSVGNAWFFFHHFTAPAHLHATSASVIWFFFFNVAHKGVDVDVANFFGLREVNLALNVLLLVALIAVLATIIETRIQIIERIGNYH